MVEVVDVIVLGAGLSGLSAAKRLQEQQDGVKVVVLEARDRVGGRTCTEISSLGSKVDCGAGYIGPNQNRVLRLAEEFGMETYKVYDKGSMMFEAKPGVIKHGTADFPPLNPIELLDFNATLVKFEMLVKKNILDVKAPWDAKDAAKLDAMSVQDWANENCQTEKVKLFFPLIVDTITCKPGTEVSMLYFLWGAKTGDCLRRLMNITDGAQERKLKTGTMSISEAMETKLGGEAVVRKGHVVDTVEQQGNNKVVVRCKNGATFEGKRVIVAFAPPLYKKVNWVPALPESKKAVVENWEMGSIIKTNLFYKTAWWRERKYSGQVFSPYGPVSYSIDDCKPDGTFPSIMGFVLSTHCREVLDLTPEQRKQRIIDQYYKMFQCEEAKHPIAYVEKNWCVEEFSGGCYVAVPAIGKMLGSHQHLQEKFENVHFAGTETADQWVGYMDGAIQAGERCAQEILHEVFKHETAIVPKDKQYIKANNVEPKLYEICLAYIFGAFVSFFALFSSSKRQ